MPKNRCPASITSFEEYCAPCEDGLLAAGAVACARVGFGAQREEDQNEEGRPHQGMHRALHNVKIILCNSPLGGDTWQPISGRAASSKARTGLELIWKTRAARRASPASRHKMCAQPSSRLIWREHLLTLGERGHRSHRLASRHKYARPFCSVPLGCPSVPQHPHHKQIEHDTGCEHD